MRRRCPGISYVQRERVVLGVLRAAVHLQHAGGVGQRARAQLGAPGAARELGRGAEQPQRLRRPAAPAAPVAVATTTTAVAACQETAEHSAGHEDPGRSYWALQRRSI